MLQLFVCEDCGSAYTEKDGYNRHQTLVHNKKGTTITGGTNITSTKGLFPIYPGSYGALNLKEMKTNEEKTFNKIDVPRISVDENEKNQTIPELSTNIVSKRLNKYLETEEATKIDKETNLNKEKTLKKMSKHEQLEYISKSLNEKHFNIDKLISIPPALGLQLEVSVGALNNWCNQVENYINEKKKKRRLFISKKLKLLSNFEDWINEARKVIVEKINPQIQKISAVCQILEEQYNETEQITLTIDRMLTTNKYSANQVEEIVNQYELMENSFLRIVKMKSRDKQVDIMIWNKTTDELLIELNSLVGEYNKLRRYLLDEFSAKIIFTLFLPNEIYLA